MKIVVITGGSGYIGSAITHYILENGDRVINIDIKKPNSKFLSHKNYFWAQWNLIDNPLLPDKSGTYLIETLKRITYGDEVIGLIHMAAYKDLTESYCDPGTYYSNNLISTIHAVEIAHYMNACTVIFSSSSAVYSDDAVGAIPESYPVSAPSPYGYTKLVGERIVEDMCSSYNMSSFNLRYCNPVGGIKDITEDTSCSMFGNILNSLRNGDEFLIFGGDYDTSDGTCIRDYIDIRDIAEAHIHFLDINYHVAHRHRSVHDTVNVGTGIGVSCLDVCKTVGNHLSHKYCRDFHYSITSRREGDAAGSYADVNKLNNKWSFRCKHNLESTIDNLLDLALLN